MQHRIFGIAWKEDVAEPIYPDDKIAKITDEGRRLRSLALSFWEKIETLPLGTRSNFFEKELHAWKTENDNAEPDEDKRLEIALKASKNYEVEYAARRFNIDILTMQVKRCSCCNITAFKHGIFSTHIKEHGFSHSSIPNLHCYDSNARKFAYENPSTKEFMYESERNKSTRIDSSSWHRIDPICTACFYDISKKKQPTFGNFIIVILFSKNIN